METKGIITVAVTVTVAVIVLAGLLMPALDDATEVNRTVYNKGVFRMTDSDTDLYSLTYDPTGKFVINGVDYPFAEFPAGRWTLISTDAFMFRFQAYSSEKYALIISDLNANTTIASTDLTASRTWTFEDGTYTGYDGVTTRSYTSESFRAYDPNGSCIMTNGVDKPVVKGDSSIIIGHGLTIVAGSNVPFYISGTVDDGVTVTTKDTVTVSNIAVNAIESDSLKGCYVLNSVTFDATLSGTTVSATYDRIIVPYEITAELNQHLTDSQNALLAVIPILVIVAILLGMVAVVLRSRMD